MALIEAIEALQPTSPATLTAGADAQLIGQNLVRSGLNVNVDSAATAPVYLLLRQGIASATNWDIVLVAGGNWDGRVSDVVWRGAVRFFSTAAGKVGVVEI